MKGNGSIPCAVALLVCLLTPMLRAQSDQPSLADVAKQKSAAKARRVVTNDEIPPSPEANNPPPSSAAASSDSPAPTDAKQDAKSDTVKDGDKSAKEKMGPLQLLLADRDNLENIIKHMQEKIAATTDPNRIAMLNDVVQSAKDKLVEKQREIDKLKAGGQGSGTEPAAANPQPGAPQASPPPK